MARTEAAILIGGQHREDVADRRNVNRTILKPLLAT
jgi:hypothetical protein